MTCRLNACCSTLSYLGVVAGDGFEPPTSGLWAQQATWLLHPAMMIYTSSAPRVQDFLSGPGGIRTPTRPGKSRLLCAIKLQAHDLSPAPGTCTQTSRLPAGRAPYTSIVVTQWVGREVIAPSTSGR